MPIHILLFLNASWPARSIYGRCCEHFKSSLAASLGLGEDPSPIKPKPLKLECGCLLLPRAGREHFDSVIQYLRDERHILFVVRFAALQMFEVLFPCPVRPWGCWSCVWTIWS